MSHFKFLKIGDFCITGSGGTPSRENRSYYENGTIPWIKSGELRESTIESAEEFITESAINETSTKLVPKNAVLLAMYGATVGRLAILGIPAATNQAICHIIPDPKIADTRYLYHALRSQVSYIISRGVGGAQPNINQGVVRSLSVPIPSLEEQKRIVDIIDKADSLRTKRREAITLINSLTQSIFLEMFGNPRENSKSWPLMKFGEACETRLGKMLDAKKQTGKNNRPYLRNANVQWGKFDLSEVFEMDFNEEDRIEFSLKKGDVLICEGGEVGRAAVWNNDLQECYFQKALHRARPNIKIALPEYIRHLMEALANTGALTEHTTSVTIAHLTGIKLKNMMIPIPPIELQHRFEERINKLLTCKVAAQESERALSELFSSIQKSSFSGEL